MLKAILAEFQQAATPLCLEELSRKLAIEAGALEGMLQTLIQHGRLWQIDPQPSGCTTCPARGGCVIMTNGIKRSYALRPKSHSPTV